MTKEETSPKILGRPKINMNQIKYMKVGDVGYVSPFSVRITYDSDCFLNKNGDIKKSPDDDNDLRITRLSIDGNGYQIDFRTTKHSYELVAPKRTEEAQDLFPVGDIVRLGKIDMKFVDKIMKKDLQ